MILVVVYRLLVRASVVLLICKHHVSLTLWKLVYISRVHMLAVALTVPCISCINYDRVVSIIMPINVLACVDTDLPINLSQFVVCG